MKNNKTKHMVDFQSLNRTDPIARDFWAYGAASIAMTWMKATPGNEYVIEGLENLPREPAIVAMNHSHMFDFLALRAPLLFKGHTFVSWVKARNYRSPAMAAFLARTGNVPICSRGYIIAADYFELFGERMGEDEYRSLRDHVDTGVELPPGKRYDIIQSRARPMLGWGFNASGMTYRDAIQGVYAGFMQTSMRLTRQGINRGDKVHIYPQGTVASRLTRGRPGVIQAALAFGLPIVTVGVSGAREGYVATTPRPRRNAGKIVVRIGETLHVDRSDFPSDFKPFDHAHERLYDDALMRHTDRVMGSLNALLDEDERLDPTEDVALKKGLKRFF